MPNKYPTLNRLKNGLKISVLQSEHVDYLLKTYSVDGAMRRVSEYPVVGQVFYVTSNNEDEDRKRGALYIRRDNVYDATLIYDYEVNRYLVKPWGDYLHDNKARFYTVSDAVIS